MSAGSLAPCGSRRTWRPSWAWCYPDQRDRRHLVHVGKLGSWALLVTLSFVLVAAVKAREGTLYGDAAPRVTRA